MQGGQKQAETLLHYRLPETGRQAREGKVLKAKTEDVSATTFGPAGLLFCTSGEL